MIRLLPQLLEDLRRGDSDAVDELVQRFRPEAMRLATPLLGDEALAEDAVQEAFVVALQRLNDLRDPASFQAWWRQIVRSQCTRLRRKRVPTPVVSSAFDTLEDASESAEAGIQRHQIEARVRAAVSALPDAGRITTELFYFEERSQSDIASMLGVPTGTVKRRLHDARHRLRDMLIGGLADTDDDDGIPW